jgi:hypothetical protein
MQVFVGFSLISVLWCVYGYSLAFTPGNRLIGGLSRLFLAGTFDPTTGAFSTVPTFSKNTTLYELVYVGFQATFAAITGCLILGAVVERIKFSAVLLFLFIWFTFSYCPIAHMVWYWPGADAYTSADKVPALTAQADAARSNLAQHDRDGGARVNAARQQTSADVTAKARAAQATLHGALTDAQNKAEQASDAYVQLLALAQLGRANQLPAGNATGATVQAGSYVYRISGTT